MNGVLEVGELGRDVNKFQPSRLGIPRRQGRTVGRKSCAVSSSVVKLSSLVDLNYRG